MTTETIPQKKKRLRMPTPAKPGELKVAHGKLEWYDKTADICYLYGAYGAYKGDAATVGEAFERARLSNGKTLVQYLKDEGFDISTIKFSISHIDPHGRDGSRPPGDNAR